VERPLGHKEAPVLRQLNTGELTVAERPSLSLVEPGELEDAQMRLLAHEAMVAIQTLVGRGEPIEAAVTMVIRLLFGDHGDPRGERVVRLLRDTGERNRITAAVLEIARDFG
jgi:hypothetical protein